MDYKRYKDIPYGKRSYCLICEKKTGSPIIEMPQFPVTEIYVDKRMDEKLGFADQGFHLCANCGHGQIENVIDVEFQYGVASDYFFRASQSATSNDTNNFFIDFVNSVIHDNAFNVIVELGCNDLSLLKSFKTRAKKLFGIDPILKDNEDEFNEENIIAIGDFFENVNLDQKIDVVLCKDTLEHIANPKQFVKKILEKATNETKLFFQFPLLDALLVDCRFDQIFHQHLNYFSLKSILYMLDELGCGLLSYTINYDHWGSILIAFQKGADNSKYRNKLWDIDFSDVRECYKLFKTEMELTQKRLENYNNEIIYGYGAALMLPVLSYHLVNGMSYLKCIIDDDKDKEGMYYINLPIEIVHKSKIDDIQNSAVLITAIFSKINLRKILINLLNLKPRYIIYPLRTI